MADGQLAHARAYCEMAQPAFVRDWGAAEAAGGQSRAQLLQRLRSITEMQKFLSASAAAAASGLLNRWERHYSAPQDSLAFWEQLVSRRHLYIGQLPGDALPPARQQRHLRHSRLQLVEAALGQRNATAATRQLSRLRSYHWDAADAGLTAEY